MSGNACVVRPISRAVVVLLIAACVAVLCVLPVAVLSVNALTVDGNFSPRALSAVLSSAREWGLLTTSLTVALGTALGATLLGAPIGYALEYARVPARPVLLWGLALPFLIPPYVLCTAWVDMLGTNGYLTAFLPKSTAWPGLFNAPGVVFVQTLSFFPIVAFATVVALRRFDGRFAEAARLAGQGHRVFRHIVLPLTAPAVMTGALAVFAWSLLGLSVPSLLQVNTYPVEIYASSATFDYAAAAAQALPLVLAALAALGVWALYLRPRRAWLSGARREYRPLGPRRLCAFLGAGCWALFFVSVLLPLFALFVRSLPLRTYVEVWNTARGEFATSLLVSLAAATAGVLLSFLITSLARGRAAFGLSQAVAVLPFAVSGPLLGLGMIAVWNRPGAAGLVYDSLAIVILACVARYLVFGNQMLAAGHRRLHPRLEEAARLAGVSWWRILAGVVAPLQWPYLVACWGLLFVFCMGELDAAVLVCPPGDSTLAVRLFTLMHYGPGAYVAALSLLMVAVMALAGLFTALVYSRLRKNVELRD